MAKEKKLTATERLHNLEMGMTALIRKTEMLHDIISTSNNVLIKRGIITAEEFNAEFVQIAEARLSNFMKLKDELEKLKDTDLNDAKSYDEWADVFEEERGVKYDRNWYKTQREDHATYKMNRKEASIVFFQNPLEEGANV